MPLLQLPDSFVTASLSKFVNFPHSPHCRACKQRVYELLHAIYGACSANKQFPWPARPEDYADAAIGNVLEQIRTALGDLRGHHDFIKSAQMPPCDYFISNPPFIVEFDENQHFSRARLVTLANYPVNAVIGFPISRWRELCRAIDAKDDEPFDRDERRAWYDTLRDLLPSVHGFGPTVRLYAEEFPWCTLDPASAQGVENFRTRLRHRLPNRIR
jgi:hypothetical protein